MAEGAVRLGHAVRVFALLDRVAAGVRRIEQLTRQAPRHRVLAARPRGRDQPADRQRLRALGAHLDRHLIGRTTDAAAADLDARLDVVERFVEHAQRILLRSEEHTSELQSLMSISYAVFCLQKTTYTTGRDPQHRVHTITIEQ